MRAISHKASRLFDRSTISICSMILALIPSRHLNAVKLHDASDFRLSLRARRRRVFVDEVPPTINLHLIELHAKANVHHGPRVLA